MSFQTSYQDFDRDVEPCVASVVLNYNSASDLIELIPSLTAQVGISNSIIIVDNDSSGNDRNKIVDWLKTNLENPIIGSEEIVSGWVDQNIDAAQSNSNVYFIENIDNRGYSAGNNIGIKLADKFGAVVALVINPDIRIFDQQYLKTLVNVLLSDDSYFVVGSRILNLDGEDESPLVEASFWQETFWFRSHIIKFLKPNNFILKVSGDAPITVPKVSGCCMLLRMSFLRSVGYFDEGVFLYCEEPILSKKVHERGGSIAYYPNISVVHAHVKSAKDHSSRRMQIYIESRWYFLERYSSYNKIQLLFLKMSYKLLSLLHEVKLHLDDYRLSKKDK